MEFVKIRKSIDKPQPENSPPKIPYPRDAGVMVIRPGDVIMTRSMFDFIVIALSVIPNLTPAEQSTVCNQISNDLKELIR